MSHLAPAATPPPGIAVRGAGIQVYVVAPQIAAWGLQRLVQTAPRMTFAGGASTLDEAVRAAGPCDVALVDFDEGGVDPAALAALHARTGAPLLALAAKLTAPVLDELVMHAGVRGVVSRHDSADTLLRAIGKVHDGELWIDRGATGRIFMQIARNRAADADDPERQRIGSLTSRERQTILALADATAPAKVIAARMCISEHTLRNHLTSIYGKLGLANRLDLYAFATRHRLNKP